MRVNLNQLHVFYLAARHGSMSVAAELLYVSPPAVTMQIKKLETWLGFPVFERGQSALKLTERGKGLYDTIRPMFKNIGDIEQYVQGLMSNEEAELRFGTHHLPANFFVPDLIAQVRDKYPELRVQMELGTQDELLEKLFQQKLDLAIIIGEQTRNDDCKLAPLFNQEIALVTDSKGIFGQVESISARELDSFPLILQQKGTGALHAVLDFLKEHQAEPNILLRNLSSDVIKQFLQKMPSAAFIVRFIVQKELDEGILHEINIAEGPPLARFYLAYMDAQYPPVKIQHFLAGASGFKPKFKGAS